MFLYLYVCVCEEVPVPCLDAASEAQPDDGDGAEHASEVERATVPLQNRRQTGGDALRGHREHQHGELNIKMVRGRTLKEIKTKSKK